MPLDNWALLWAQRMALKQEVPLFVTFCMPSTYLDATIRQYRFMIEGLKQVEKVRLPHYTIKYLTVLESGDIFLLDTGFIKFLCKIC